MQIFPAKSNKKLKKTRQRGVTLIEILLVVVLIGGLAGAVIPKVTSVFRVNVKSSVRRFSALIRHSYDQAILTGLVHRIVLDLDKQSWILENAVPGVLPVEKLKRELVGFSEYSDDEEERLAAKAEASFKKVDDAFEISKPDGVKIVEVSSWRLGEDALQEGQVSIYAFPNGFIDEAQVVLAEEGKEDVQRWRIITKSLTGRTRVEVEIPE